MARTQISVVNTILAGATAFAVTVLAILGDAGLAGIGPFA